MSTIQPISSAALSALIWELEADAEAVFGDSPIGAAGAVDTATNPGKRLLRAMTRLRTKRLPAVIASMNTSETTFVRRSNAVDVSDPLAVRKISVTETAYAYIHGPSDADLERGNLSVSDYQVVVAANDLTAPLTERDAVRIDGRDHDIIEIIPYPAFPSPIAYRLKVKRAA